jgi:hypothetical protein
MKTLLLVAALALVAIPATAQLRSCYSWENEGTVLGFYGNLVDPSNVMGMQDGLCGDCAGGTYSCPGAYDGDYYLHVAEDPHSGTPQAYLAWITGLNDGDEVTATFYYYDITPSGSPSMRIWGHYTDSVDPESYVGSASGPADYGAGTGWDALTYTWTFGGGDGNGLMVEGRLYSSPATDAGARTDYWIDYICVTAPVTAEIHFPQPPTPVDEKTWSTIKSLYR